MHIIQERILVEVADPASGDHSAKVRLPAQTIIHRQPGRHSPAILNVQAEVSLPFAILADGVLSKARGRADEEVGHRQPGYLAIKGERACRIQIDPDVVDWADVISAKLDLMISPNHTHVIRNLVRGGVKVPGIRGSGGAVQSVTHRHQQILGNDFRDPLNSQVGGAEKRHLRFLDAGFIESGAHRINRFRADHVCVAEDGGSDHIVRRRLGDRQRRPGVAGRRETVRAEIAPEE